MDETEVQLWQMHDFETAPGALDFPIEVHGVTLSYAFKYTRKQVVFASVYDSAHKTGDASLDPPPPML